MCSFGRTFAITFIMAALASAMLGPPAALSQIKSPDDLKKGSPSGLAHSAPVGRPDQHLALKRKLTRDEALSVLKAIAQRKAGDGTPTSLPTDLEMPITLSAQSPARANRAYLSGNAVSWDAERGRIILPGVRSPASSVTLKLKSDRRWQPMLIGVNVVAADEGTNVVIVSTGPGNSKSGAAFCGRWGLDDAQLCLPRRHAGLAPDRHFRGSQYRG